MLGKTNSVTVLT